MKNYSEALGFEYLSASNKEEYLRNVKRFCDSNIGDTPMLFEVFTDTNDESEALKQVSGLRTTIKSKLRNYAMEVVGGKGITLVKKLTGQY